MMLHLYKFSVLYLNVNKICTNFNWNEKLNLIDIQQLNTSINCLIKTENKSLFELIFIYFINHSYIAEIWNTVKSCPNFAHITIIMNSVKLFLVKTTLKRPHYLLQKLTESRFYVASEFSIYSAHFEPRATIPFSLSG